MPYKKMKGPKECTYILENTPPSQNTRQALKTISSASLRSQKDECYGRGITRITLKKDRKTHQQSIIQDMHIMEEEDPEVPEEVPEKDPVEAPAGPPSPIPEAALPLLEHFRPDQVQRINTALEHYQLLHKQAEKQAEVIINRRGQIEQHLENAFKLSIQADQDHHKLLKIYEYLSHKKVTEVIQSEAEKNQNIKTQATQTDEDPAFILANYYTNLMNYPLEALVPGMPWRVIPGFGSTSSDSANGSQPSTSGSDQNGSGSQSDYQ